MLNVGPRIRRLRRQLGESQAQFADRFGVDQSTVSKWEGNKQDPESSHLDIIASLEGDQEGAPAEGTPLFTIIPLTGYVGAGAVVYPVDTDATSRTLGHIKAPKGFGAVQAIRVRGDSMYPAYRDGDIIYIENRSAGFPLLPEKEYLLTLADGRQLLKMVEAQSNGRYNLVSHNAPTERDVVIEDAQRVRYIRRG